MMHIIAYTYEAGVHCPACTLEAAEYPYAWLFNPAPLRDENGILLDAADREGNPIHPVFSTDEHDFTHCGDCGAEL
jgi:hypothetical protein